MSAIRLGHPSRPLAPARAQLRSVSLANTSNSRAARVSSRRLNSKVVSIATIGALSIALFNLVLHILTSTAVYELASLQKQARELNTTSQIIAGEVDSLSSQQNLANSAQKLGMIANANPVFLSISEQKVYGKPKAALKTDGRLAKNLIPNSVLSTVTSNLVPAVAAENPMLATNAASAANVANPKVSSGQVISNSGVIPTSPTH